MCNINENDNSNDNVMCNNNEIMWIKWININY